jgi:hypothetical protein
MSWKTVAYVMALSVMGPVNAWAQDPPPPIGPLVVDVRGMFPSMSESAALAASRGISTAQLPGRGLGVDFAAHAYPLHLGKITVGLGAQLLLLHASSAPEGSLVAVESRMTSFAPQLSLNFGTGDGWSYISGGIGTTRWSIVPVGAKPLPSDEAWVLTYDGGGGARWFVKPHLAFHIDARLHSIEPGPAQVTLPGSPRVRMFVISAGISLKPF